jgi:hypothetical protein
MDQDVDIFDIIKPIWNKKYLILLHLTLFIAFVFSFFSVFSYVYHINKDRYWIQDVTFNSKLNENSIKTISNDDRIERAYTSANLTYTNVPELNSLSILKGTSKFDVLKDTVLADSEELLLNVISDQNENEEIVNFWDDFLNVETSNYKIVLRDPNLTDIEASFIIGALIDDFNYDYMTSFDLNSNKIGNIAYDPNVMTYVYMNDRLSKIKAILQDKVNAFRQVNFDASEIIYRVNKLLLQIYNEDPSPLEISLEKFDFEIKTNKALKQDLELLHTKFYNSPERLNTSTENPSQITVDAITQLIDIGKEFSQLDYQENIIDSVYNIDLNIKVLEQKIFDMLSLKKQYLIEDHIQLSAAEMNNIAKQLVEEVNSNISILDSLNLELPVNYIGNTYKITDSKFDINIYLLVTFLSIIFLTIYILRILYQKK